MSYPAGFMTYYPSPTTPSIPPVVGSEGGSVGSETGGSVGSETGGSVGSETGGSVTSGVVVSGTVGSVLSSFMILQTTLSRLLYSDKTSNSVEMSSFVSLLYLLL